MSNTKNKKKISKASIIIYSVCAALLVIGIIVGAVINSNLQKDFEVYEKTRPNLIAHDYFSELFGADDYSYLYKMLGFEKDGIVTPEEFNAWMTDYIADSKMAYARISTGLSKSAKFLLFKDNTEIGSFMIEPTGIRDVSAGSFFDKDGYMLLERGEVTLEFPLEKALMIKVKQGSKVTLNGIALSNKYIIEKGEMVNGAYEIYAVNCLENEPEIKITLPDGSLAELEIIESMRKYADRSVIDQFAANFPGDEPVTESPKSELLNMIKVVSGHKVYVNGELLDPESKDITAGGIINLWHEGKDSVSYDIYFFKGDLNNIAVKDESGKERSIIKVEGGNIYTDSSLIGEGTIEIEITTGSKLVINGFEVSDKYLTGETKNTKYSEYIPEGLQELSYRKYKLSYSGEAPEIKVINKYGNESTVTVEKSGLMVEAIPFSEAAKELYEDWVLTVSKDYATMLSTGSPSRFNFAKKYIDSDSEYYDFIWDLLQAFGVFFREYNTCDFRVLKSGNYYMFNDETFVCQIFMTIDVTRENGKVKNTFDINRQMYFKKVGDKFLLYNMTNELEELR